MIHYLIKMLTKLCFKKKNYDISIQNVIMVGQTCQLRCSFQQFFFSKETKPCSRHLQLSFLYETIEECLVVDMHEKYSGITNMTVVIGT